MVLPVAVYISLGESACAQTQIQADFKSQSLDLEHVCHLVNDFLPPFFAKDSGDLAEQSVTTANTWMLC